MLTEFEIKSGFKKRLRELKVYGPITVGFIHRNEVFGIR